MQVERGWRQTFLKHSEVRSLIRLPSKESRTESRIVQVRRIQICPWLRCVRGGEHPTAYGPPQTEAGGCGPLGPALGPQFPGVPRWVHFDSRRPSWPSWTPGNSPVPVGRSPVLPGLGLHQRIIRLLRAIPRLVAPAAGKGLPRSQTAT